MKKHIAFFSILVFLAIIVSVLKIIFSAATSTAGIDLNEIQAKEALLDEENTQLSQTVYNLTSLNTIAEEAEKLGFVSDSKSAIFIGNSTSFALK